MRSLRLDPGSLVDAVVEPIKEDWEAGRKGEAVGRATFEIGAAVLGTKGLNKAGVVPDTGKGPDVDQVASSTLTGKAGYAPDTVAPVYGKKGVPDDEVAQAAKTHNEKPDEVYGKWEQPADYSEIKDPANLESRNPTPRQKEQMKAVNRAHNNGILRFMTMKANGNFTAEITIIHLTN